MSGKLLLSVLAAAAAFGADDPWAKVREIKSGSEIRVYKKGSKVPIVGKLDQATDDAVVVMLKKEEIGIEREEIDRIDSRPAEKGPRMTRTQNTTPTNPAKLPPEGPHNNADRPDEPSTGGGISFGGSHADFETVYTRPSASSRK